MSSILKWLRSLMTEEVLQDFAKEKSPVSRNPKARVAWLISRHQLALEMILTKSQSSGLTEEQKREIRDELNDAKLCAGIYTDFVAAQEREFQAAQPRPPTSPSQSQQIDADAPRPVNMVEDRT